MAVSVIPYSQPPYSLNATGWTLVLDGTNLAHGELPHPDLDRLCRTVDTLKAGFRGAKIRIYFDASTQRKVPDDQKARYQRAINSPEPLCFECPSDAEADEILLGFAKNHGQTIVVSNDRFNKGDELHMRIGTPLLRVPFEDQMHPQLARNLHLFPNPNQPQQGTQVDVLDYLRATR